MKKNQKIIIITLNTNTFLSIIKEMLSLFQVMGFVKVCDFF